MLFICSENKNWSNTLFLKNIEYLWKGAIFPYIPIELVTGNLTTIYFILRTVLKILYLKMLDV